MEKRKRITVLTSEQIQMIMDEWYDKLDIQTKYGHQQIIIINNYEYN